MGFPQQQHLPQDQPASQDEQWPFNLVTFLEDQWLYLVAILVVLGLFFYARYRWRKRQEKNRD